jgi:hypothetical protein
VNALPPDPKELSALLRLLDDDTPEVRSVVARRLAVVGGADLGTILLRILNNLIDAFIRMGRGEDAALVGEMRDSMAIRRGA